MSFTAGYLAARHLTSLIRHILTLNALPSDLFLPVLKELLSVEFLSEGLSVLLQLLALHMGFPPFTQHCLHTLKISLQLSVNLGRQKKRMEALHSKIRDQVQRWGGWNCWV